MNSPTFSIDSLQLDLRGLPRDTAEAVPQYLGAAFQEVMAGQTADRFSSQPAPARLTVTLDRGETAPAIARRIAEQIIHSCQSSTL